MKKLVLTIIISVSIGLIITGLIYFGHLSLSNRQQLINNNQQTTINRQQSTDNSQQATSNNEQITDSKQPCSCYLTYEQAVIRAVEKVSPSIVSIIISKDLPIIEQRYYEPFSDLPEEFRQFFKGFGFEFSMPQIKGKKKQEIGGGSGFIISSEGLILTNKHVVSDKEADYTVLDNDGEKYKAEILAVHPSMDVAILKIKPKKGKFKPVELGDSDKLKLGQTVISIGNALGEFRNTVSKGVISGLRRDIAARGGTVIEQIKNVIQTDAAINKGNSGGPLINLSGQVIGVNVAMVSGAQNIGFAIPINQVKRVIKSVKSKGKIVLPFLGVRYVNITKALAEKENLPVTYGALLRGNEDGPAVIPDSAACKAGLMAEDIILEVNGQKLDKYTLGELILKQEVGDEITLKVLRKGQNLYIKAKLGKKEF